jgi:hypothetical protein
MPKSFMPILLFISLACLNQALQAQFPPAAGQQGTDAMYVDSSAFIGWATGATIERGWQQIGQEQFGPASFGQEASAIGKADLDVVSLGDGGTAILTFDYPLGDGPGPDFAVFENSFSDTFLELAFVEVSSDGEHYVRFPAFSLTQSETQVDGFGQLEASLIQNLAGKYRAFYGVPFDLAELADSSGLDIQKVTHIRVMDVIGCILPEYAQFDATGNSINDPWPTPFPSSGFDLDAVGVIHDQRNLSLKDHHATAFQVYPNPFTTQIHLNNTGQQPIESIQLIDMQGRVCMEMTEPNNGDLFSTSNIKPGVYLLMIRTKKAVYQRKMIKK